MGKELQYTQARNFKKNNLKEKVLPGGCGTCLSSQPLGGRDRQTVSNSRSAWSTQGVQASQGYVISPIFSRDQSDPTLVELILPL